MTTTRPVAALCAASARDDVNRVWDAMGRGPNNFARKVCPADPGVTWETPATHYYMNDEAVPAEDVATWQALALGDLPQISGTWGADGVIDAAAAQAATSGANLQVYTASGNVVPTEHAAGVLQGRNLMFVPDPPL